MSVETTSRLGPGIEPVTFSVLVGRFNAVVGEMTTTLERSARSVVLALARDFSCAVYDRDCRQVAMGDALPIHTGSMDLVVRSIADAFVDDIGPGDLFLCNSPYHGNTHVADLVTAAPVFDADRLLFWSVTRAHQMDAGAYLPSASVPSAGDVYHEGLHIPPLRLSHGGVVREDVVALYSANLRYTSEILGDLHAQMGATRLGVRRLGELIAAYGAHQVSRYVDEMIAYASRRMSRALERIPDGTYHGRTWLDTDGQRFDVPIEVTVTVEGDHVTVDFTGSPEQGPAGINASFGAMQAAGRTPFLYYMEADAPRNQGALDHVEVRAELGSICHARFPASTSMATVLPADAMQDAINRAMAIAAADRVPAGGPRNANTPTITGSDDGNGSPWGGSVLAGGGGGAVRGADGWPLMSTMAAMGGLKSQQVEDLERMFPIDVHAMELAPDSSGFGEWNGGPGIRIELAVRVGAMTIITRGDGARNPAHGIHGGRSGAAAEQVVLREDGRREEYAAIAHVELLPGDRWIGTSAGGGGYGRPERRDPERVVRDVRNGVLSPGVAEEVFGVVLSTSASGFDAHATVERRRSMLDENLESVTPQEPNAARRRRIADDEAVGTMRA